MKNNLDIREDMLRYGLRQYEVAREIGISEYTLSRWLRDPLTGERKKAIIIAILRLKSQKLGMTTAG